MKTQASKDNPMTDEARELYHFVVNDPDLYRQRLEPIRKNLLRKKANGTYKSHLASKAFRYAVDDGAKRYTKTHAPHTHWFRIFSVLDRDRVAYKLVDEFEVANR
jgi:hypothetical protein